MVEPGSFSSTLKPAALLTDRPSRFLARAPADAAPDSLTSTIGSSFLSNTQPDLSAQAAALPSRADARIPHFNESTALSKSSASSAESFETLASSRSTERQETGQGTRQETGEATLPPRVHKPRLSAGELELIF